MSGRAPFFCGIGGPRDGFQCVGAQFGNAVLEKGERGGLLGEFGISGECGECVGLGAEAVHQEEGKRDAEGFAGVQHLAGDEVEEGEAVFHGEQGLCLVEAHAGSQAAVEFENDGLRQRALTSGAVDGCFCGGGKLFDGNE